jgi:hypothetical protein
MNPHGLLAMIKPETNADWWKIGVGIVVGVALVKWGSR